MNEQTFDGGSSLRESLFPGGTRQEQSEVGRNGAGVDGVVPVRRSRWRDGVVGAILLLVGGVGPLPDVRAACTLLWGTKYECLKHGELAKEGLAVDNQQRSFSVGYTDRFGNPWAEALLMVRDGAGGLLTMTPWAAPGTQNNFAAGLWIEPGGGAVVTAGTCQTGNIANPANLVITGWLPGPGVPWTSPVQFGMTILSPSLLGLKGNEMWGCRVIEASPTDLFVSGCTDVEIFVVRISKSTLGVVPTWGFGGVQSVASASPPGCPTHEMPGAFGWFLSYRQSFIEIVADRLYLGGTLHANAIDHDFVVACYKVPSGVLELPFGVRWSGGVGDEYMKAMAATPGGVYAVGTLDPYGSPQMELVAWRPDGLIRAPGIVKEASPSRGNDVEAMIQGGRVHVLVGGYAATPFKFSAGATWHFRHGLVLGSPVQLPSQWSGSAGSGPNPKVYGPALDPFDEVFDLGLGTGAHQGHVFATGQALLGPTDYGQPLQCIAPNGTVSFSNNPNPLSPLDDRGVAVEYRPAGGGAVFTHGTAADIVPGFWNCTGHWISRHSRFVP